ncbi:MAG: glycoside hydrolase family 13 protein [Clostridia bacterium]|nr:glycoside hydrolase family 13 protein [Clostridia bacterium]
MTDFYFDPLSSACKSETGAVGSDKEVKFVIFTDALCAAMEFRSDEGEIRRFEGEKTQKGFLFRVKLPVGLYFYTFIADGVKIGKDDFGFAQKGGSDFQYTVYDGNYEFPKGLSGGIIYQIFPDRFCRGKGGDASGKRIKKWGEEPDYLPVDGKIKNDDFFGGNFSGIESMLAYIKDLGVNYIYLNPVSKAHSNHRYDTGNYLVFDPLVGDDEDFKGLVKSAEEKGIYFIFDGVFNHTGDDSLYFNKYHNYPSVGAYESENSPYRDWYVFGDNGGYLSWWGIDILPTIRRGSEGFENLICGDGGVIDRYFGLGVKGVRLDVVDELGDDFVAKINAKVKSYGKDNVVIGEVWEDATNKIAYDERKRYFLGGELDGVMNYPLKEAILSFVLSGRASVLYKVVREQIDHYPKGALDLLMNILGTHDTPRVITYLGKSGVLATRREDMAKEFLTESEYALAVKRLKCASLLQFTLYGVPTVYYGDETGMQGNKDPFNRRCFSLEKADEELIDWYKFLGRTRRKLDCFKGGETTEVGYERGVFYFTREGVSSSVTVAVNCGEFPAEITTGGEVYEVTRNVKLSKITLNTYDFAMFFSGEEIADKTESE